LGLADHTEFTVPAPDPALGEKVRGLIPSQASRYGITVLDISDPANPVYAEHNGGMVQNPGSVGKLMVLTAWMHALAALHPNDIEARRRLLRETQVTANIFIHYDHHTVPLWKPGDEKITKRPLKIGDTGSLYTFLDHMVSVSSNAAAGQLQQQLVLLKSFGPKYPVSAEQAEAFFKDTPKTQLKEIFLDAMLTPLEENGIDTEKLRQGSFFTREGKNRVPGTNSIGTASEFTKLLVRMEQGKLVDRWSSEEMKRLLYLTDRRIRYASAPALKDSGVYFKSGSLYSCKEEVGFTCQKYHGNVRNYMNSTAIVETKATETTGDLHYIVVVLSNVLRENSAVAHQTLATRIHRMMEKAHKLPPTPVAPAPATQAPAAGSGDPG
jgi:hypothetical protein